MDAKKCNYYRILQVQPDAPFDVIRHNYTILLQKLRMHPDLGGNNAEAALINVAYETLCHPKKRAEYDQWLLRQNTLLTSSQLHLTRKTSFLEKTKLVSASTKQKNQRNYYRILQVHPDAHPTVIRERYMSLLNKSDVPNDLLDEAYLVLNNPQKRVEYDRLLKRFRHRIAVKKMQKESEESNNDRCSWSNSFVTKEPYTQNEFDKFSGCMQHFSDLSGPEITSMTYKPLITRYCEFCKTPHFCDAKNNYKVLCSICDSPLFFAGMEMVSKSTRCFERIKKSHSIIFYIYWPGQKLFGHLLDISPKGLCFKAEFGLDIGQIIKIEGEKFKAVAEVVHSQVSDNISTSGVCFRTVLFNSEKGNFLLTSV